ncbi:hypothetical protein [Methylomonas sp. MgM2]
MENLIDLALFAAAAYGIKSYFFTPLAPQNIELFSSRAAISAKRLVTEQTKAFINAGFDSTKEYPEETVADAQALSSESELVLDCEIDQMAEPSVPEMDASTLVDHPAEIAEAEIAIPRLSEIPEDAVLKRHYFAELAAQCSVITDPHPTDSVLSRHYQQRQNALLELSLNNGPAEITATPAIGEPVGRSRQQPYAKRSMPEDSVLRRHVLSLIRHEIENQYPSCPSDAVLRRHHRQLIESRIDAYWAGFD